MYFHGKMNKNYFKFVQRVEITKTVIPFVLMISELLVAHFKYFCISVEVLIIEDDSLLRTDVCHFVNF